MSESSLVWNAMVWAIASAAAVVYAIGWRRARGSFPRLTRRSRLAAAVTALAIAAGALSWPLDLLSATSVLARMGQTVLICLIAAPLLWLACPFHIGAYALPHRLRSALTRSLIRPTRFTPILQVITSPLVVWFLYLSAVLTWHDPGFVDATMARPVLHRIAAVLLLVAALLFWQQITLRGPRRYARADLASRLAMLVGIEIADVIAGISIAYRDEPLYAWYAAQGDTAQVVVQQSLSGALTWVFGSVVYILSAVLVVNQIFKQEGVDRPHRPTQWDADERFIAPGLEGRLQEASRLSHDWRDY